MSAHPHHHPHRRGARRGLALGAVLALGAAACGGDDDDAAVPAPPGDSAAGSEADSSEPAGTSGDSAATSASGGGGGGEGLTIMIGSSGDAETNAVIAAAERYTEASGTPVEVIPAQDLVQQLTQGFAGGSPPDVFYVGPEQVRTFQDSLYPYGSEIDDVDDFYPALIESYTIDDELYCLPKDFSNLALVINTAAWEEAGLTDDDIPTNGRS